MPIDEDEVVEITTFGDAHARYLHVGLDYAWAANRTAYVEGHIDMDTFEAEVDRLMRKRRRPRPLDMGQPETR